MKNWILFIFLGGLLTVAACGPIPTTPISPILGIHPKPRTSTPTFTVTPTPTKTSTVVPTPFATSTPGMFVCAFAPVTQWGGSGIGNGLYMGLNDLALDGSLNIYPLDSGNKRVQKLDATGGYLTQWNSNNSFLVPTDIVYSPFLDRIYVLDTSLGPPAMGIVKPFSNTGTPFPSWVVPLNSKGLAVDASGNVYVGEQGMVVRFSAYGFNPTYYYNQGAAGVSFGGVKTLAVDASGNLFVAQDSSIQKFNSSGQFVAPPWGSQGSGIGQFSSIVSMAADAVGNLFIVDNPVAGGVFNGRVQKFDNNGQFICYYQVPGVRLLGIAFDNAGDLYVVDNTNQMILKFTP